MLRVVLVGDRVGFRAGTPDGNYVELVVRSLRQAGLVVDRLPDVGAVPPGRWGYLAAVAAVVREQRPDVVLYYGHSMPLIAWLRSLTRRGPTRFVLDAVEWPPANRGPGLRAWARAGAYARWAYRLTDAVVVISAELERQVAARPGRHGRPTPTHRLPILVDRSVAPTGGGSGPVSGRYVLYCGDLGGYLDDVLFALRSVALVGEHDLRVVLVGRGRPEVLATLHAMATELGIADRLEVITEVLPYEDLLAAYAGAEALLAPLPDDLRSRARFPSKLADYLLSGRPVVASAVGEVGELLVDGRTAYLADPGSEAAFAEALRSALTDPDRDEVGRAGRARALDVLDHRQQGERLAAFLATVVEWA